MSGKVAAFRRRLANVENALADAAEQEKQEDCICIPHGARLITIAFSNKPEEFEADMNEKCPAHGFRSLGQIISFRVVASGRIDERCRLDELLEEYRQRESQYRTKLEHDQHEP